MRSVVYKVQLRIWRTTHADHVYPAQTDSGYDYPVINQMWSNSGICFPGEMMPCGWRCGREERHGRGRGRSSRLTAQAKMGLEGHSGGATATEEGVKYSLMRSLSTSNAALGFVNSPPLLTGGREGARRPFTTISCLYSSKYKYLWVEYKQGGSPSFISDIFDRLTFSPEAQLSTGISATSSKVP